MVPTTALLVVLALLLLPLGLLVLLSVCNYRLYTKVGLPGWTALIPIYSTWVLCEQMLGTDYAIGAVSATVAGSVASAMLHSSSGLIFLCSLISMVGYGILAVAWFRVVQYLGRGPGFFVGMLFLPFIFFPILAFEHSPYQ